MDLETLSGLFLSNKYLFAYNPNYVQVNGPSTNDVRAMAKREHWWKREPWQSIQNPVPMDHLGLRYNYGAIGCIPTHFILELNMITGSSTYNTYFEYEKRKTFSRHMEQLVSGNPTYKRTWSYIWVYNRILEDIVRHDNVKDF